MRILLICLAFSSLSPAFLRGQDNCANPAVVDLGTYEGSTDGADSDGSATCGTSSDSPAVWYSYTATEKCSLRVSTCGSSFDTVLTVYSSCPASSAVEIACDDDTCSRQSRVSFGAEVDQEYLIRVSGFEGASGSYSLELTCTVDTNTNTCRDAEEVGAGTYVGSTTDLGSDGSSSCGNASNSPDAWYKFSSEEKCFVVASTCGSAYDTVLSVHTACPGTTANEIACNDDACDVQSTLAFTSEPGRDYYIRVSGYDNDSGDYTLNIECNDPPEGDGPDLVVSDLDDMRQVGRIGDTFAVSVKTVICNTGSDNIEWFANPNPRHPFLVFNAYRQMEGRFEQIGQSWVKHGFSSSQGNACGMTCLPFGGSDYLGVGCSDVYGVSTNASRSNMSLRSEINSWNGSFVYEGSYMQLNQGRDYNAIELRIQMQDDDVDPALNPGAEYYYELLVLSHDDIDRTNSIGYKNMRITGDPGGDWNLSLLGGSAVNEPSYADWEGVSVTTIPEDVPEEQGAADADGRCRVLLKTTDNGDGTWLYDYAVFNLDFHQGVDSFSVPLGGASATEVEFHAPRNHDDGISNEDWSHEMVDGSITWNAPDMESAKHLHWGTLFNFRFTSNAAPSEGSVTLGLEGSDAEMSGPSTVPLAGEVVFRRGDADGNGAIDITDAIFWLSFLFQGGDAPPCFDAADSNDSGELDISDGVFTLLFLFSGGGAPPSPGPANCGPDITPSDIPATCNYTSC